MRYPIFCVVLSVQQLSAPVQHICCSSGSLSDLLASPSSELLSAFFPFTSSSWCSYFHGLACFVVFSYPVRSSISLDLP